MDAERDEWVVYHPPKSVAFGHQSRIRDPRRAWPTVERFLNELTQFIVGHHIGLTCHDPSTHTDPTVATARIDEARRCFGPEIPQGVHRTDPRWNLSESQIASAVQFALDDDRFPTQQLGPTRFSFGYQFTWNEFNRPAKPTSESESRNRTSFLGIIVGQKRLFLQPNFIYPAPWNSESLKDFIDRTESIVPFRFRDQYFKRWLPPRSPTTMHGRHLRLDVNRRRGSIH
jgi:hypothetical protein